MSINNRPGKAASQTGADGSSKKRAPLRHVAIEKAIEGPSRKKRSTVSSPGGANAESDNSGDEEDLMDTVEAALEDCSGVGGKGKGKGTASSSKTNSKLLEQAREQRRDIYSEELTAHPQSTSEAIASARRKHGHVEVCAVSLVAN